MGEIFQDYSQIHDFEADFPQKVSHKILNLEDYYNKSFSDLSVCYNLKVLCFVGILQVLRSEFLKFRILEI